MSPIHQYLVSCFYFFLFPYFLHVLFSLIKLFCLPLVVFVFFLILSFSCPHSSVSCFLFSHFLFSNFLHVRFPYSSCSVFHLSLSFFSSLVSHVQFLSALFSLFLFISVYLFFSRFIFLNPVALASTCCLCLFFILSFSYLHSSVSCFLFPFLSVFPFSSRVVFLNPVALSSTYCLCLFSHP